MMTHMHTRNAYMRSLVVTCAAKVARRGGTPSAQYFTLRRTPSALVK